jgi:hypothetical protein
MSEDKVRQNASMFHQLLNVSGVSILVRNIL